LAEPVRPRALLAQLRNPALVAGHYGAYTFVSPALLDISGVSSGIIGIVLLTVRRAPVTSPRPGSPVGPA
jgi:predicted MFS family arabinose efflux permease